MNFSFISVIGLVGEDQDNLNQYLENVHSVLKDNFSDYEIILVNNKVYKDVRPITASIPQDVRKDVTVINLSGKVPEDNAIFAGLDRANGDYAVFLDLKYYEQANLVLDLYNKTQKENIDIVYLKHKSRKLGLRERIAFKMYYKVLNSVSDLAVDINMDKSRIISRRALNSLLRLRETVRYFKGLFAFVGYDSTFIEVDLPKKQGKSSLRGQMKFAVQTYISFTDILSKLLLWIFIFSFLFSIGLSVDALLIKFFGFDIFGVVQSDTIPGWSFLIVTISVMFTIICLILYIMSLYLSQINKESKNRPVYIIESIQRI